MSTTRATRALTSARRATFQRVRPPILSRPQSGGSRLENIIDSPSSALLVSSITESGLELSDGLVLRGPCIILNNRAFLWEVPATRWDGWGKERFEIFDVVVPRPDILFLGTGPAVSLPPPSIRQYLNGLGIQVDIMDTRNACSTYNLLLEEGRRVAAALLPIKPIASWRSIRP